MMLSEDLDRILDGDDAMLLEPRDLFDACVIGIAERINLRVAAYDVAKVLQVLMDHHGMDEEEAEEYFDFNIAGSWVGEGSPVFVHQFGEDD
jgi:hypothetical protein